MKYKRLSDWQIKKNKDLELVLKGMMNGNYTPAYALLILKMENNNEI